MRNIHVIMTVRFYLCILLAPYLPVDTRGLAVPSFRQQAFLLVLGLVHQPHKYLAVTTHILHGHIHQEFNIAVSNIQRILTIDNSVLVTVMLFPNNSVLITLKFQGGCKPFGVEFVELILLKDYLVVVSKRGGELLRPWDLPEV